MDVEFAGQRWYRAKITEFKQGKGTTLRYNDGDVRRHACLFPLCILSEWDSCILALTFRPR